MTKTKTPPLYGEFKRAEKDIIYKGDAIHITFMFGTKVDISGYGENEYIVEFWNGDQLEYMSDPIRVGHYAAPAKKYVVPWHVKVFDKDRKLVEEHKVDFKGKNVFVSIDSKSLGDTIAWVPQVIEFGKIHRCNLTINSFHNYLFEKEYPDVAWVEPASPIGRQDYLYTIGYFMREDIFSHTPEDPRTVPLGKVASDIMGIDYEERKPLLTIVDEDRDMYPDKYVCIATHSTGGCKYWQRENGWQDVVDYLNLKGYQVAVIHQEENTLKNVLDWTGDIDLSKRITQIQHAEFFVGLPSGLSWMAWALGKKTVMISGFSAPFAEYQEGMYRVQDLDLCKPCWNDTDHQFDKGDWWWCPRHKGTPEHFACTKKLSAIKVIEQIEELRGSFL